MASEVSSNSKFLDTAKKRFDQAWRAEQQMREDAKKSAEFNDGKHWTDAELQQREAKGKPVLVANKLRKIGKRIANDIRRNMPRTKASPRNKKSMEGAEIIDNIIRHIEQISNAEDVYHNGLDQSVTSGYGYWRIVHDFEDDKAFDQVILMKKIPVKETVYKDPSSIETTGEDAGWYFISDTLSTDEYREKYPGKPIPTDDKSTSSAEANRRWFIEDQVRVAEYFYKKPVTEKIGMFKHPVTNDMFTKKLDGSDEIKALLDSGYEIVKQRKVKTHKVMWALISGSHILEQPREFPSKFIPIVPVIGNEEYVNGIMKLRSAAYDAIDIQKAYDYILNKAVERLSLSANTHYMVTPNMIKGHENQWNNLHKENYPYVLTNVDPQFPGGTPQKIPPIQTEVGALQQMAVLDTDIKDVTGAGEAFFGQRSNERTGVAIDRKTLAASITLFTFASNFLKAILYNGRIMIDMIPRIYDTDRAIMIMGDKGQMYDFVINRVVGDIETLEPKVINDVTDGEYDYVAEAGINFMTQLKEFRQFIIELLGVAPEYRAVLLPMFLETSEVPDKEKLIAEVKAVTERNNALQEAALRQGQGQGASQQPRLQ